MSDERVGLNLVGVPRNGETEYYFRIAANDGDSTFLSVDAIFEETLVEELAFKFCNSYFQSEVMNPIMRCYFRWEKIVHRIGAAEALKKYVGEDPYDEPGSYWFHVSGLQRSTQLFMKAQEILSKYQVTK